MPDISALLAQASPRELPVQVCLAGDLAGELELLQAELTYVGDGWVSGSMADVDPRVDLVRRIEAVRERMRASVVTFRMRSLGYLAFSRLIAEHPAPAGARVQAWDEGTFLPALVAACCTDPVMSVEQAGQLLDVLNHGQAQALFAAALAVNEEATAVPFS